MTAALLRRSELMGALLVTAAALIVYRAGLQIPMPGIEPKVVAQLSHAGTTPARISIFGLDIYPLFGILILAELAKVFAPPLRRWERAASRNRDKLARIVVIVALFSAVAQATGIAVSLDGAAGLVTEPGLQFRLPAIATLVAGTALVTWLAGQITRRGLGSGLWLIIIAPTIAGLPQTFRELSNFQSQGVVSGQSILVGAIFVALAFAAVAAMLLAGGRAAGTASACVWTTVLAYATSTWLVVALSALARAHASDGSMPWVEPGHPVRLVALAVMIVVFAMLYARSVRLASGEAPAVPPIVSGTILAAIAVGSELLPYHFDVPLPLAGQPLLVIAIVATTLLRDWGKGPLAQGSGDQSSAANR